jgi:hypothetical protein
MPGHGLLELEPIQGFVLENVVDLEQSSEPVNSA